MYHSYFGLKEQVFSIAVDPHYLYMSSQHREALAHLLYGVSSGGFVLLTGEVGTGKTTIVRCLLEQLPQSTELAIVLNPVASAPELLCNICDEFRISYDPGETSIKVLMDKLYHYLLDNHTRGAKTVLLIDEAQLLRISTLEQIRLLTNLETNTQKLLQIILVGQPELNRLLAKPSLRQLSQRITARYHLHSLSLQETQAYISHRLYVGGMRRSQRPFPDEVIQTIHRTSRGIPRLINVLCDRMLLGAYSQDKTQVDAAVCEQARLEVMGEETATEQPPEQHRKHWLQIGAVAAALVFATGVVWAIWPAQNTQPVEQEAVVSELPVEATKAPQKPVYTDYSFDNYAKAVLELFKAVDVFPIARLQPCNNLAADDYQCETDRLSSWNELLKLNRPAVLRLITPAKQEFYAALVGLDEERATLRFHGDLHTVFLTELGPLWTGDITYVWRKPESFIEPVGLGVEGPVVSWIAQQFAELDGQEEPLADTLFNEALTERIRIFQRSHQLRDDGVFGVRTLMVLNEERGVDRTLRDLVPVLSAER